MRFLIINIIFYSLVLNFLCISYAQEISYVYGRVFDSLNNPVSGVEVSLDNKNFITTDDGSYYFDDIGAGEHTIFIEKGDRKLENKIILRKGESLEHNIFNFDEMDFSKEYVNSLGYKNKIINVPGINTYASPSPDGLLLAVELSDADTSDFDIWIVDMKGNKLDKISSDNLDSNPRWSPDGKTITYHTFSRNKGYSVWIRDLEKNKTIFIDDDAMTPAWSPDGKSLVFAKTFGRDKPTKLYTVKIDQEISDPIELSPQIHGNSNICDDRFQYPYWAIVNGKEKILYSCGSHDKKHYNIWSVNIDGSEPKQLTKIREKQLVGSAVSPDGKKIAFWELDQNRKHKIWILDTDGKSDPYLLTNLGANPEWAHDSSTIYFMSNFKGKYRVWKTSLVKDFDEDKDHAANKDIEIYEYVIDPQSDSSISDKIQQSVSIENDLVRSNALVENLEIYASQSDSNDSINLEGQKLDSVNLREVNLQGWNLKDSKFNYSNFSNANLSDVNFKNADLLNANFEKAAIDNVDFIKADLNNANFYGANISDSNFNKAELEEVNMTDAKLVGVKFIEADLEKALLSHTNIQDVDFMQADLENSNFYSSNIDNTVLEDAKLEGSNLDRVTIQNTTLKMANLKDVSLKGARLIDVNFKNTILKGVDLTAGQIHEPKNLQLEQLCKVKSLYLTSIDEEYLDQVRTTCPEVLNKAN